MSESDETISVKLSDEERLLLASGLLEWVGPAHCSDAMAVALGFDGVEHLLVEGDRISKDLSKRLPLSRRDWTRALLATEVAFASDVVGSGRDWEITTGLDDRSTIQVLRSVQLRLVSVVVRPHRS